MYKIRKYSYTAVSYTHLAEFDDKKKLTEAMIQMIHETTKIEADNIYVIFHEFDHWGLNQTLI